MGRWTQYDEDSYRLPHGVVRTGYDADTQRYAFRDNKTGRAYLGEPRVEFGGFLEPVPSSQTHPECTTDEDDERPVIWGKPGRDTTRNLPDNISSDSKTPAPKKFSDILPSSLITSPGLSPTDAAETDTQTPADRIRRVVRSKTLPKMQGIVQTVVRRSGTLRGRRDRNKDKAGNGAEHDTRSMTGEKGLLEEEDDDKKSFISEKESMV